MTTLYLVRHGETVDNAQQILQGQRPGELNDTGVKQAQAVCDKMRGVAIDAFIASDLARSYATCEIIAKPHHKEVKTSRLLRERDWGDFTGAFIPDLKGKTWPANVETLDAIKARAQRFLDKLKADYPDQTVLAVGHGIINKAIQSVFYGKPMTEIQKMANAEVRVLKL
ncbi:MAG: histidine phosphatase family protein [Hoylesella enoeca]|uniref:histidine phosphatase family protein n=1 Tax=Hoylesella enoeca TaxID=76123 RepID=UPI003F9EC5B8